MVGFKGFSIIIYSHLLSNHNPGIYIFSQIRNVDLQNIICKHFNVRDFANWQTKMRKMQNLNTRIMVMQFFILYGSKNLFKRLHLRNISYYVKFTFMISYFWHQFIKVYDFKENLSFIFDIVQQNLHAYTHFMYDKQNENYYPNYINLA